MYVTSLTVIMTVDPGLVVHPIVGFSLLVFCPSASDGLETVGVDVSTVRCSVVPGILVLPALSVCVIARGMAVVSIASSTFTEKFPLASTIAVPTTTPFISLIVTVDPTSPEPLILVVIGLKCEPLVNERDPVLMALGAVVSIVNHRNFVDELFCAQSIFIACICLYHCVSHVTLYAQYHVLDVNCEV